VVYREFERSYSKYSGVIIKAEISPVEVILVLYCYLIELFLLIFIRKGDVEGPFELIQKLGTHINV